MLVSFMGLLTYHAWRYKVTQALGLEGDHHPLSASLAFGLFAAVSLGSNLRAKHRRRCADEMVFGAAKVYLVGAGPGAPDLISVRGLELLSRADAVLNDRLVSPELLKVCPKHCQLLNVGKNSEKERFSQKELEKELIKAAFEIGHGGIVVRLKGGDPYIYGLGASEGLALDAAGIDWEYVPGLSSAVALPGLCLRAPLTHKGASSGFIILSGHVAPTLESEWGHLPRCSDPLITLVVIMCAKNLDTITRFLHQELGWNPTLPAAVIQSGATPEQRTLRSSLNAIAEEAALNKIDEAPLTLVVGKTLAVFPASEGESLINHTNHERDVRAAWGEARPNVQAETKVNEAEWWVFGYGSLVWRSSEDLPHVHVDDGYVEGYIRRFWQASPDHRGTEENPGRVVTILPLDVGRALEPLAPMEKVFGRVYRVDPTKIDVTRERLLHREKAGYEERYVDVHLKDGRIIKASVFLAMPENDHFAGPDASDRLAKRIFTSIGPSGRNIEYFDELFTALTEMQMRWGETDRVVDSHLLALAQELNKIKQDGTL